MVTTFGVAALGLMNSTIACVNPFPLDDFVWVICKPANADGDIVLRGADEDKDGEEDEPEFET